MTKTSGLWLLLALTTVSWSDPSLLAELSFGGADARIARDTSGYAHDGRVRHAQRAPGRLGSAMSFEADTAAVRVRRTRALNLGSQLTLEAWIYPKVIGDSSRIIIAKNDEYLLRIDKQPEGGRISFFVHVGSPAVAWEPRVSSKQSPALDHWHHVVATWDGAELSLYLNGQLQQRRERTGSANPNPYPVMVGNFEYPSCHGGNFGGLIDELRIYNRALTPAEVLDRWQATGPANPTP